MDIMKPPPDRCTIMSMPVRALPCESTAVPLTRAVRAGVSVIEMSDSVWPMPSVIFCAASTFAVPG